MLHPRDSELRSSGWSRIPKAVNDETTSTIDARHNLKKAGGHKNPSESPAITREERDQQVASLRTVGGVYDYVAACVEHDNRDALAAEEGSNK